MALTFIVRVPAVMPEGSSGAEAPLSITLDAPRLVVGRGEGCDVRLPDPSVSHRHASLRQRGSDWLLVDEKSTNGTRIGGVKLAPQSPRVIRSGELVRIGRVWIELRVEPALATAHAAAAAKELALELVTRALAAEGEDVLPRVRVTAGPDQGRELVLAEAGRRYVIGRGRDADLVLEDVDASRRHVDVARRGADLVVQDLGSKGGAALDGAPLGPDDTVWRAGQMLALGTNEFTFLNPAAEALAELERSPDEPMRAGENTPAPPPAGETRSAEADEPAPSRTAATDDAIDAARPSLPRRANPGGWTMTDFAVVLFAAGVLALSVAGLVWLLR